MSPAVAGSTLAVAVGGGTSLERHGHALALARSFEDVMAVIPPVYRDVLRPLLRAVHDDAERRVEVQGQLAKLQHYAASNSLPPNLAAVKVPTFQVSKSFKDSTHPDFEVTMAAARDAFATSCLGEMVKAKAAEVAFYEQRLEAGTILPRLVLAVETHWEKVLSKTSKDPIYEPITDSSGNITYAIKSWEDNDVLLEQRKLVVGGLARMVHQVVQLVYGRLIIAEQKKAAKRDLKDSADVEMGDGTQESTVEKLQGQVNDMREAMNKLVRATNQVSISSAYMDGSRRRALGAQTPDRVLGGDAHSSHLGTRLQEGQTNPRWLEDLVREEDRRPQAAALLGKRKRYGRSLEETAHEASCDHEGRRVQHARQERKGTGQAEGHEVDDLVEIVRNTPWRYEHPYSYPDEILLIPTPEAIQLLLERVPPSVRAAARFRSRIFQGPGVNVPVHLAMHLSSGLKYLMYTSPSETKLRDAWSDFKDRLRWRVFFAAQEVKSGPNLDDFDPDYVIPKKRKDFFDGERESPAYIETGLERGDAYVNSYISNVMPTLQATSKRLNLVWLDGLKAFLEEHNYIVTPTDKNLGVAVIESTWAIEQTRKLWNDPLSYRKISPAERQMALEKKHDVVRHCAKLAHNLGRKQLALYLRSKIPESDLEESVVPRFYGVPKCHKRPVKMRPIVPCHSNAQAPAATYVSKMLKPLIRAQPYILHGSKHLAQRLEALQLNRYRKKWIISGDVVAFYPNVPLQSCLKIVAQWWLRTEGQKEGVTKEDTQLFLSCFFAANRELLIDFDDESAIQIRGLAMGIACAPDLANLYGAHFENDILSSPRMRANVPFFGRYLDDLLGIVYADTADEAMSYALDIKYEGLEIEWSVSEYHTPFLDLFLYLDPLSHRLEWKPYSKPLNHRERIPWASHHPLDVKRGTFIGEMSRLATLSSTLDHYREAIQDLIALYVARGYPAVAVRKWSKENFAQRWTTRLDEARTSHDDLFVLKSHYNPVWSSFNVHELGRIVTDSWISDLAAYDHNMHTVRVAQQEEIRQYGHVRSSTSSAGVGKKTGLLTVSEAAKSPAHSHLFERAPASLVERDGEWITVNPLDNLSWVQSGATSTARNALYVPLSDGSLEGQFVGHPSESVHRSRSGAAVAGPSRVVIEEPAQAGYSAELREGATQGGPSEPPSDSLGGLPEGYIAAKVIGGTIVESVVDVRHVGLSDRKWIVSRKKTRNLGDIVNTWKHTMLSRAMDDDVIHMHVDEWL